MTEKEVCSRSGFKGVGTTAPHSKALPLCSPKCSLAFSDAYIECNYDNTFYSVLLCHCEILCSNKQ